MLPSFVFEHIKMSISPLISSSLSLRSLFEIVIQGTMIKKVLRKSSMSNYCIARTQIPLFSNTAFFPLVLG
jgi:hypothetical protein